MKKAIISMFLLLCANCIFAISYSPDATLALSGNFTHFGKEVDPYDNYRSALGYELSINPLAIAFDNRRISFPVSLEYITKSEEIDRTRIQERLRFSLELKFDYILNQYLALSIEPGLGYTYFKRIDAGSLFLSLSSGPMIMLGRFFSLSLPFKAIVSAKEVDFELSVALSVYPIGIKKGATK